MSTQPARTSADAELETFIESCEEALRHQVRGESEPLLALWSQAEDVAILGAVGSYARGWNDVRSHLRATGKLLNWTGVSVERVLTQGDDRLAVSVVLERMTRDSKEPKARTLRVTHAFRRENDRWRLFLRHANLVSPEDEQRERSLLEQ